MSSDSKKRKVEIISPSNTSQIGRIRDNTDIDWELCCLCQENSISLLCPSNNAVTKTSAVVLTQS